MDIAPSGTSPFGGQYTVEVGGESLGHFRVQDQPAPRVPAPDALRAGDQAAVGGPRTSRRPASPVRRLPRPGRLPRVLGDGAALPRTDGAPAALGSAGEAWRKDVALVAIGIDNDRELLRRHVRQDGLATVQHLWSPADHPEPSPSAHAAYSISGVPTALLIGRDGRIVWRGHPASLDLEAKIEEMIASH
ncbi:MAG: hypothetical protein WKF75_09845 [Singulisphaera sp.]